MKRVLIAAAALLILGLVGPASALTVDEAQQIVKATGCTATVYTYDSIEINAFYDPMGHNIILMNGLQQLPEQWQKFILLHETGHCLQGQAGRFEALRGRGIHELEWDADAYAISAMEDGAEINEQLLSWLYRTYNVEGHDGGPHGTIVDRITRGRLNRVQRHVEAA